MSLDASVRWHDGGAAKDPTQAVNRPYHHFHTSMTGTTLNPEQLRAELMRFLEQVALGLYVDDGPGADTGNGERKKDARFDQRLKVSLLLLEKLDSMQKRDRHTGQPIDGITTLQLRDEDIASLKAELRQKLAAQRPARRHRKDAGQPEPR